ncbi:hypothetical protein SASPL_115235 [Salvia splendens]|uniref:GAG-pre-integrase domain-containing protein n=1 Tax=Salvia splendens TaxID=180675 RepID=A0A8X8Y222_SALSN|nr:hypothetical protein SASPL_115235 [Salvia splendens]
MMRDEILKATLGALVMLKGLRKNNLYYYQGSTVARIVATATSSNKKDASATTLWHLRLGHAGERSLQILVNQGLLKVEKVHYMLSTAGLDRKFWADAITYAQHSVNRLPCSAIDGKAPLESKKTIVSRDVTFDESSMLNKVNPNSSDASQQVEYTPKQMEFEEAVEIPTTNTTNDSPTEEDLLRKKKSKMIKRYHPKNLRSNQRQL